MKETRRPGLIIMSIFLLLIGALALLAFIQAVGKGNLEFIILLFGIVCIYTFRELLKGHKRGLILAQICFYIMIAWKFFYIRGSEDYTIYGYIWDLFALLSVGGIIYSNLPKVRDIFK